MNYFKTARCHRYNHVFVMQYWYLICIGLEPVVCQATVIPPPGVPSIYTERLFVVYYSPALVEVLISTTDD